jgi:hypothetical protein
MLRKGQIVKIVRPYKYTNIDFAVEDYNFCKIKHRKKGLTGEIIEIHNIGDGFYDVMIMLDSCKELHCFTVEVGDLELCTIKTLKHYRNANKV